MKTIGIIGNPQIEKITIREALQRNDIKMFADMPRNVYELREHDKQVKAEARQKVVAEIKEELIHADLGRRGMESVLTILGKIEVKNEN